MNDVREELIKLVGRQVEEILTDREQRRLNDLLQSDVQLVDVYADYLCLHAQLTWDTGRHSDIPLPLTPAGQPTPVTNRSVFARRLIAITAATILLVTIGWVLRSEQSENSDGIADFPGDSETDSIDIESPVSSLKESPEGDLDLKPLELADHSQRHKPADAPDAIEAPTETRDVLAADFTDESLIYRIDDLIRAGWYENEIDPSDVADDAEFVRRSYLTFAGRIPTLQETSVFLESGGPRERTALITQLLESPQTAKHLATIWTNLMIGRTERRGVNREMLFDFVFESFAENKPWIDTVGELITATGRNDENGATNFLLAHLNNQATPATAVTARLFLGEQISCVQCHDHPFSKGVKQEDYWALNAFFKDTVRETVREPQERKSRYLTCKLADRRQAERITHYETLSGQQRAVLPKYDEVIVAADSENNRRELLAELLASDSDTKIARAMVNRMWAHFFGFGFTNVVDDMGPHAEVSHPELLNLLTEAFVKSDYDVRRLMRWIALSGAWQLSSAANNTLDMPEDGTTPLFSRVYTRRMTPEQVYESVRVAIRSSSGQPLNHTSRSLEHRRKWVQQFARAYNTDENDEDVNFEGTITQALVMMNGGEVDEAIRLATDAILAGLPARNAEAQLLQRVARSILSREPTSGEKKAFRAHYRQLLQQQQKASSVAVEDMMWAYLNSSEFVLVH